MKYLEPRFGWLNQCLVLYSSSVHTCCPPCFAASQACVAGEDRFRAAGWLEFYGSNGLSPTSSGNDKVRRSPPRQTAPAVKEKMAGPAPMQLESSADDNKLRPQDSRPGKTEPSFAHGNDNFPDQGFKAKDKESEVGEEMALPPSNIGQVGS